MCSEVSTNYKDIPINKQHELFQPSAPIPWDIKSKLLFQLASSTVPRQETPSIQPAFKPLQNVWDYYKERSKVGLSVEGLIADFFQFGSAIA